MWTQKESLPRRQQRDRDQGRLESRRVVGEELLPRGIGELDRDRHLGLVGLAPVLELDDDGGPLVSCRIVLPRTLTSLLTAVIFNPCRLLRNLSPSARTFAALSCVDSQADRPVAARTAHR